MFKHHFTSKQVTIAGVLIALQLILTRLFVIETPFLRISFLFVPTFIMAILFGPLFTGLISAFSDTLGLLLFGKISLFFPGFTVSAFLTGFIFGCFFYKKPITMKSILIAVVMNTVIVDICLNTLWLYLMMGNLAIAQFPLRLIKAIVFIPIQVIIMNILVNQPSFKKKILKIEW